jgi:hypothetical protein
MSPFPAMVAASLLLSLSADLLSAAENRWKLSVEEDEITGEQMHSLALAADDGSVLVLITQQGKEPLLTLVPAKAAVTIFPDATDAADKTMNVNITMRSTKMPKAHSASWSMLWMNYGQASTSVPADLASNLFSGESVTIQFDKMGKRIKFPTKGDGLQGFDQALERTLKVVADEPALAQ